MWVGFHLLQGHHWNVGQVRGLIEEALVIPASTFSPALAAPLIYSIFMLFGGGWSLAYLSTLMQILLITIISLFFWDHVDALSLSDHSILVIRSWKGQEISPTDWKSSSREQIVHEQLNTPVHISSPPGFESVEGVYLEILNLDPPFSCYVDISSIVTTLHWNIVQTRKYWAF